MGTRSTIALEFADGTVEQVYCHWDGYLDNNGKILLQHWSDPFKLQKLIDLGNLSSLGKEVGVEHPFDNNARFGTPEYEAHKNMCLFYGRDRGDADMEKEKFKSMDDYVKNSIGEEYDYILRNVGGEAVWYVRIDGNEFVMLDHAIEAEEAADMDVE